MSTAYTATPTVMAFRDIAFHGNIIPMSWYKHLTMDDRKPNLPAIIILSDIVYWYRPTEVRDETTGHLVGYKAKFKADKLQRSYDQFADQFGLTKRQAKDAINYLLKKGIITREFRSVASASGALLGNVMFVEPVPTMVEKLNQLPAYGEIRPYDVITPEGSENTPPYDDITPEGDLCNDPPLAFKRQTLTESTTKTTTKTPPPPCGENAASAAGGGGVRSGNETESYLYRCGIKSKSKRSALAASLTIEQIQREWDQLAALNASRTAKGLAPLGGGHFAEVLEALASTPEGSTPPPSSLPVKPKAPYLAPEWSSWGEAEQTAALDEYQAAQRRYDRATARVGQ